MQKSNDDSKAKFKHLKLKVLSGNFKYILFSDSASFWKGTEELKKLPAEEPFFLFHASDDRSMMVPSGVSLSGQKAELDWKAIRIVGEMPFGTVQGLIASISEALRKEGLGVCVISTFLTDFFFIKEMSLKQSLDILRAEGWEFVA